MTTWAPRLPFDPVALLGWVQDSKYFKANEYVQYNTQVQY
jgi:hypothetical protein